MNANISLNEGGDWQQVGVSNMTPLTAVIDLLPGLNFGDFILIQVDDIASRAQVAYTDLEKNVAVVSFLKPEQDSQTLNQKQSTTVASITAVELLDIPEGTFSSPYKQLDRFSDPEITNVQAVEADLLAPAALPEESQSITSSIRDIPNFETDHSGNDLMDTSDIPEDFLPEIPKNRNPISPPDHENGSVNSPIQGDPIEGFIEPERIEVLTDFAVSESDTQHAVTNVNSSDPPAFFEEGNVILFYTTEQFVWHYEQNLKNFALLVEETPVELGTKHQLRLTILGSELSLTLNCQVRYAANGLTGFSLPEDHESQAMLRGIYLICRS